MLTEVFSFPVYRVTVSSGRAYLDVDITLSSEAFHNYMNAAMVHINRALKLVIRLFLVEDLVDSLKVSCFYVFDGEANQGLCYNSEEKH